MWKRGIHRVVPGKACNALLRRRFGWTKKKTHTQDPTHSNSSSLPYRDPYPSLPLSLPATTYKSGQIHRIYDGSVMAADLVFSSSTFPFLFFFFSIWLMVGMLMTDLWLWLWVNLSVKWSAGVDNVNNSGRRWCLD